MLNKSTLGLLVSSGLAAFGTWIDFLAILSFAAYGFQASAFLMALVSALFLVPALALAPAIGRLVDRSRPDRILIASLVLRAAATALLLAAPSIWIFCLLVALRSTLTIAVDPASNVLVGRLVSKENVPRYFGILGVLRNTAKIAAPVIGMSISSLYGESLALTLSVAITVVAAGIAAACLLGAGTAIAACSISPGAKSLADSPAPAAPMAATEGVLLTRLLFTVTIYAFVVFFINNQLPVLLRDAGFDKALLGVLVSCSGAGGILAAMYMTKSNAAVLAKDPMTATTISVIAVAVSFVALGLAFLLPTSIAPYAASAVFFTTGVFASIEAIRSSTVVVQNFPSHTGEVSGKIQSYSSAAMLAAPWLAAFVIPHTSLPFLLIADGAMGLVAIGLVAAWFRATATKRDAVSTAA